MAEDKIFYVGLTMAGAISAGAYTAGVFDFLIEALDEWEAAKARGEPVPSHQVVIPVMSGASAGGITGAVGMIALADRPQRTDHQVPGVGTVTCRLPRMYLAWVQGPRFVGENGGNGLLGTADLGDGPLGSLLDTTLLGDIVNKAMLGMAATGTARGYLAKSMHLFVTHANMRGIPYEIKFAGGDADQPGYPMTSHGDRRHFRVTGIGATDFESPWADPDPATELDVASLIGLPGLDNRWNDFAQSVLGTGAFPVGLKARKVETLTVRDFRDRQWPISRFTRDAATGQRLFRLPVAFPPAFGGDETRTVGYVTVDGGLINNEPFELARWTLMDDPPIKNPRAAADADRAVIMVDPFPEPAAWPETDPLDDGLIAAVKKLIPTLKDQARFKPDDLVDALDENVFSRYLIAPRRWSADLKTLEKFAIACGLLGGFGGFLSEKFRAHDYQLGRLNCYRFLKYSFAMPRTSHVLREGYAGLANADAFKADDDGNFQIIPLVGTAKDQPAAPTWPKVTGAEVDGMVAQALVRGRKVLDKTLGRYVGAMVTGAVWRLWAKGKLEDYVRKAVTDDLIRRGQLDGA